MSAQITLVPVWSEESQRISTTRLRIRVDVSEVFAMLDQFDLLIETEVVVQEIRYPNVMLLRGTEKKELDYTIAVIGKVSNLNEVHVKSTGYWLHKQEVEGG